MKERIWTISNGLSALRIVLIIPIAIVLLRNDQSTPVVLYGLIGLAVLTDLLDGKVARSLNQVTDFGKMLDPLADKLIIGTLACILAWKGAIPFWFVLTAVTRDIIILAGAIVVRRSKHMFVQSNLIGKWTVTLMAAFITAATVPVIPQWIYNGLVAISTGMMGISLLIYAQRFFQIIRSH